MLSPSDQSSHLRLAIGPVYRRLGYRKEQLTGVCSRIAYAQWGHLSEHWLVGFG